ncbi:MAG: DUF1343 domain-containing protein [Bacteroidales bacterium]|nr:DUF1343 domain-containing protein [Bacteroidales bacterium]
MSHSHNLRLAVCLLASALTVCAQAGVKPGIEVLRDRNFKGLEGRRVALLSNPSGVDSNLKPTVDILVEAPQVNLVALFAPEHGIRGNVYAGGSVEGGIDDRTGLPVHSLHGATREPTAEMLKGIDVVVYDIQDVGSRSYTFISTLGLMMRACARLGIKVMVLDRPNPLGGLKTEGPLVEDGFHSFVGEFKIPYIYGLTVGELANLINSEGLNRGQKGNLEPLSCELEVVPMEGWERGMLFGDTGLPWVLPSPNIPEPLTAVRYPAAGLVGEFQNYLQIGIGYSLPFGVFAAEWIDADRLKERLDSYHIEGVAWRTIHYTPFSGSCARKLVHGVQFYFTDFEAAPVTLVQFYVMQAVQELYGRNPFVGYPESVTMFDKVCGTDRVKRMMRDGVKVSKLLPLWNRDVGAFRELARRYWLYR